MMWRSEGLGSAPSHDLLYIEDFITVKQIVTIASVEFDDDAVADYFDRCADDGMAHPDAGESGSIPIPAVHQIPVSRMKRPLNGYSGHVIGR